MSIERHLDCFVSNFEEKTNFPNDKNSDDFKSNYLSVAEENEIQFELEDKTSTKIELDELLFFIEDELNIKSLFSVESTIGSSSSSEGEGEDEQKEIKENSFKKKGNMRRKFFNIELRLRAYLKEQETFYSSNSILNESKLKTPLSKISSTKKILPSIIKNFFEDKSIIEEAKKRFSVRDNEIFLQIARLDQIEETKKCQSNFERISIKNMGKQENSVSMFSIDVNIPENELINNVNIVENNNENVNCFNFKKRGSIFKERYLNFNEERTEIDEDIDEKISQISDDLSENEN